MEPRFLLSKLQRSDGSVLTCGDIASTFPSVKLFFDGEAVMNLAPSNYLYLQRLTRGITFCMGWMASTSVYTIFGDIVPKGQLVVYDNVRHRGGWKPFDCHQIH